jgi:MtN3 and saliva related transmembrane protein
MRWLARGAVDNGGGWPPVPPAAQEPRESRRRLFRMDLTTLIGSVAALCTTVSYFPQLRKCWTTGSAGDLSFATFATLATGVGLWTIYGVLKSDLVIIAANFVSLCLLLGILAFKLREDRGSGGGPFRARRSAPSPASADPRTRP